MKERQVMEGLIELKTYVYDFKNIYFMWKIRLSIWGECIKRKK